ncbi:MAG: CocE/NonD family hydrolase [Caulobacterales bacterium]|nr:CocE/NonD family hydrolase [Caulobacterales bacterium]
MFWLFLLTSAVLAAGAIAAVRRMRAQQRAPSPAFETMVKTRDGVGLLTRVWLPREAVQGAPVPTVLTRGYRPGDPAAATRFTAAGYAYVGQAARGEGGSQGELDRFARDPEDGEDALAWIASQSWSDGDVAMYGRSFWGLTQWAVAPRRPASLKAIIPQNAPAQSWECGYWCGGALSLAMTAAGRVYDDPAQGRRFGWEALYRRLPLIDLDMAVSGRKNGLWRDYVSHDEYGPFWERLGLAGGYGDVAAPTYLMAGWYDYYAGAALDDFAALKASRSGGDVRVIVAPTDHLNRVVGDRDFGPDAATDDVALAVAWLDHVVRGRPAAIAEEPPVRLFVMGANEWRYEQEWPLARTRFTPYYFRSPEGARVGALSPTPPGPEAATTYRYDPDDPVPTLGGNHSFLGEDHPEIIRVGAVDQRPNEARDDVLVFTTDPLTEDVEVTGPIEVVLWAASSAEDTDFTAKLIDVAPDGTAYNLCEGIILARFRDSLYEPPKLLTPNDVYRYTIRMRPTSNVFLTGHRIRVHLTSSNFPLWDRNLNTGGPVGFETRRVVAEQTIHHDADRPSHIVLPIIPRARREAESPKDASTP